MYKTMNGIRVQVILVQFNLISLFFVYFFFSVSHSTAPLNSTLKSKLVITITTKTERYMHTLRDCQLYPLPALIEKGKKDFSGELLF